MSWLDYRSKSYTRRSRVLPKGALSVNSLTGEFKLGDGRTLWEDLPTLNKLVPDSRLSIKSIESVADHLNWVLNEGVVGDDLEIDESNPYQINILTTGIYAVNAVYQVPLDAENPVDFSMTGVSLPGNGKFLNASGVPAGGYSGASTVLRLPADAHFQIDVLTTAGAWDDVEQSMEIVRLT